MENIEYYIEQAKNMPNTSDGGSAAYHFDDVVLVKYVCPIKYGIARKGEEVVAEIANQKNTQGVRTPYHYAIKRETVGTDTICWVLQERAKGICYSNYKVRGNPEESVQMQAKLVDAPQEHFEKLVKDVCELFVLDLETKPKNIYYDENPDGGFTLIDLIDPTGNGRKDFDSNSIEDIYFVWQTLSSIARQIQIMDFETNNPELLERSSNQTNAILNKIFNAMETSIPNFEQHRRWILRMLSPELLQHFEKNGTPVGDLTLTEEEMRLFNKRISAIVAESIEKIKTNQTTYGDIKVNVIRNKLISTGLNKSWLYHPSNSLQIHRFEDLSEAKWFNLLSDGEYYLRDTVLKIFDESIKIADSSPSLKEIKDLLQVKIETEMNK